MQLYFYVLSVDLEPLDGIEPTTHALQVRCSTPELQRLGRMKMKGSLGTEQLFYFTLRYAELKH